MKAKKTNIYFEYFSSPDTILTQSQKRLVVLLMVFAGLFVLQTIIGMSLVYFYALTGMLAIAAVISIIITEEPIPKEWE